MTNRPDVTALARQLARQQAVIAERDAEIARLQARVAELEGVLDSLDKPIRCEPIALKKVWLYFGSEVDHATE